MIICNHVWGNISSHQPIQERKFSFPPNQQDFDLVGKFESAVPDTLQLADEKVVFNKYHANIILSDLDSVQGVW